MMKTLLFRPCLTLFSLCLTLSLPARTDTDDVIKNYIRIGRNEGIASNHVTAIADDIYRRIWIGTAKGLNIYDSHRLTTLDRYSGSPVFALHDTGREMLIATRNYVETYDYGQGTFSRITWEGKELANTSSVFRNGKRIILVADHAVYSFENGRLDLLKSHLTNHRMCMDKFGSVWALHNETVYRTDARFDLVKSYRLTSSDQSPVTGICLYADSKGSIWIGTMKDGLYRYNRAYDEFRKEDLSALRPAGEPENINSINEDRYDRLWIGHNSGVAVYDYGDSHFKNYMFENSSNMTLTTTITAIHRTKDGNMALGSFFTGFFYVKDLNSDIRFSNLADYSKKTGVITANGIVKDDNNRLWVGTNSMGISILDADGERIGQISQRNAPINDNIVSLARDETGNVWAGSLSKGLYRIGPEGKIAHYIHQPGDRSSLTGTKVYALHALNKDSLIVAGNKGVDVYLHGRNMFASLIGPTSQEYEFCDICPYGDYLYITDVCSFFRFDRKTGKVGKFYYPQYQDNHFQCSYVDGQGRLWLGTAKGELLLFEGDTLITCLTDKHLARYSISNIQGDSHRNLWLTSGNNILQITPEKKVRRINLAWGMGENEFNVRSSYTDKDGRIYFGTTDGLIDFLPQDMAIREKRPPELFISDFRIFKNPVLPGESGILKKHINNTKRITLGNRQNALSFQVASIDFTPDEGIPSQCVYKLENVDNDWNELHSASREISYTGLSSGKYRFHTKLLTDNGDTLASKKIEIVIRPPFLLRWYMIVLYLFLLCVAAELARRFVRRQRQTKALIGQARREQEELTRLNALKLDFFTFISHEFKTPLSIISTLQNEIIPASSEPDSDIGIFKRSVKRLEFLINQLMEFRNMESQHTSVKMKKYDIVSFSEGIFKAFVPLYKQKEIACRFVSETETLPMMLDADKMEMLLGNLLSNAIKHTRQGGRCELRIARDGDDLVMDVFNTGNCLTEEQKAIIFQPYYRTDSSGDHPNSGIGLAIVQSIAQLLHIRLEVLSVENEGNIFRVRMPVNQDDSQEISQSPDSNKIVDQIIDNTLYIEEQNNLLSENDPTKFLVLIVDDDSDTRKLLRKKLQPDFDILSASTAKEALVLLKSHHPDVIISDVYLPEMDGFAFCRQVKDSPKLQHIPVFLITSGISAEARMQGIRAGADVFLQKPVNLQELILRLNNILRRKNVLRDYYSGVHHIPLDKQALNNADEIFIKKLTEYINGHLSDPDLSTNQLVRQTNISRTKLYLNVKRLTGLTPSKLILNIKMDQARNLLLSTSLTASEISWQLGYCNPNHFSRQFKEIHQVSPGVFRKRR